MIARHEKFLVAEFQRSRRLLKVDGDLGPNTAAEIEACAFIPQAIRDSPLSRMRTAMLSAIEDVGLGGDPGQNNDSPYITELRVRAGLGSYVGSWCAVFVSAHLLCKVYSSAGARRVVANFAAVGTDITSIAKNIAGPDFLGIASWPRGTGWQGHVRFVGRVHGRIFYCEGNGRGDLVRWGFMTHAEFSKQLLQAATI